MNLLFTSTPKKSHQKEAKASFLLCIWEVREMCIVVLQYSNTEVRLNRSFTQGEVSSKHLLKI